MNKTRSHIYYIYKAPHENTNQIKTNKKIPEGFFFLIQRKVQRQFNEERIMFPTNNIWII